MAQYDGAIRINTNISTKDAKVQLSALQHMIVQTADEIASLRSKMNALKDQKIPTERYKELQVYIDGIKDRIGRVREQMKGMEADGLQDSDVYRDKVKFISEMESELEKAKGKVQELVDTGKAFTLGKDTDEYKSLAVQLGNEKKALSKLVLEFGKMGMSEMVEKSKQGFKKLGDVAKRAFSKINKSAKKSGGALSSFGSQLKGIVVSALIFNQVNKAFSAMSSAIKAGFSNLYKDVAGFRASVDSLKASTLTLRNSFAAAFRPLVEIAIPYIQRVIDALASLMNIIGQFTAAITGQKTYTKAIKQTTAAIEDENKAQNKQLSGLDKLNNLSSGGGGGVGGGASDQMFEEEVPIEGGILDIADRIKEIFSGIFDVFREAWESKGQSVIDSAKAALASLGEAAKSVGTTFYEVFTGGAGFTWLESGLGLLRSMLDVIGSIATAFSNAWNWGAGFENVNALFGMLTNINNLLTSIGDSFSRAFSSGIGTSIWENILGIITGIYNIIGNLAKRIAEAWNTAGLGDSIWSGILGIIGVIIENIRHASDVTAEWAKNIDFSPFLTKLQGWIDSLVPVFDSLSGVVADFYEKVLLPLGKWTIEKGLPELLRIMTDFNNEVDWESIRKRLSEFWDHLEPFAETIGEGLLIFIDKLSKSLADFINSPAFESFLSTIENWMDNVRPEDVANGLEKICKAILGYKALSTAFGIISFGAGAISKLASALKFFGVGGGAEKVSSAMKTTGDSASGMGESFGSLPGIVGNVVNSIGFLGVGIQSLEQVSKHASMDEIFNATSDALAVLEQKYKDGSISIEEYKEEADKLSSISATAMMKNDSESIGAFNEALDNLNQKFNQTGENMELFGSKALETGDNITAGLVTGIENVDVEKPTHGIFEKIISTVKTLFGIHSPSTVMEEMGNFLMEGLFNGISALVDKVASIFGDIKEKISGKWEEIKENTSEVWDNIKGSLSDTWENVKNNASDTFENVRNWIAEKWNSVRENTGNTWGNIKSNLSSTWENIKNYASNKFEGMRNTIADKWNSVKSNTGNTWDNVKSNLRSNWDAIKNNAGNVFDIIKSNMSNSWGNMKNSATESANQIKDNVLHAWDLMKNGATNIWNALSDAIRNPINSILAAVESLANGIINGINGMIGALNTLHFSVPKWVPGIGGESFGFDLGYLSNVSIPRLATGTVVPPNREFMAVLGDNKKEPEVVSPISTMKQANKEALLEVLSELGLSAGNSRDSGNETFVFQVDGNTFFEIMRGEAEQYFRRTGRSAFPI